MEIENRIPNSLMSNKTINHHEIFDSHSETYLTQCMNKYVNLLCNEINLLNQLNAEI